MRFAPDYSIYKKRTLLVAGLLSLVVVLIAFLNYQTDDEVNIGVYDYVNVPECADYSGGVISVTEGMGLSSDSVIAEMPTLHVDAGRYTYDLDHQNTDTIYAVVLDGDRELGRFSIPENEINTHITFNTENNLYNLRIRFLYSGKGDATIKRGILYAEGRPFYYDTVLYAALILLAIWLLSYLMIRWDFFHMDPKDKIVFCGITVFLILINYLYYRPFSNNGSDISFHIARMEATYNEMIKGGQLPIVMYTDALHGRGMIGVLYPSLFLIIPALLRMIHISADGAMRVFFIIINITTCGTAYYTSRRLTGSKYKAAYFTVLYGVLLYRVTTITYRYAYGETQAFIFMPLVLLGLYEVTVGDKKKWGILSIGMTGLIQCHVISTIQAAIICSIFGIIFVDKLIFEKRIIQTGLAALFSVLLNLWYIIPFMTYYRSDVDTKTHLSNGDMSYITYFFTDMLRLFPNTSDGGQRHHQMGLVGLWLLALVGLSLYYEMKKAEHTAKDRFAITAVASGLLFMLVASKSFPWMTVMKFEGIYNMAKAIQFSSRFYLGGECLMLIGSCISLGDDISIFTPNPQKRDDMVGVRRVIAIGVLVLAIFQAYAVVDSYIASMDPFVGAKEARYIPDILDGFVDDYVPEGYWDSDEGFPSEPTSPDAEISGYIHDHLNTSFSYLAKTDTYVDVPLVYYIGYEAKQDDGQTLYMEKGDHGCMRVFLSKAEAPCNVVIDYVGSLSWKIAVLISALSALGFLYILIRQRYRLFSHVS